MKRFCLAFICLWIINTSEARIVIERNIDEAVTEINKRIKFNLTAKKKNFIVDFRKNLYGDFFLSKKDREYINNILTENQKLTGESIYVFFAHPLLIGSFDNLDKIKQKQQTYVQKIFEKSNLDNKSVLLNMDFTLNNEKGKLIESMKPYVAVGNDVKLDKKGKEDYCIIDEKIPDNFGTPPVVKYRSLPPESKSNRTTIYGHTDNETHHILNILTSKYKAGTNEGFHLSVYKALFETYFNHGNPKMKVHRKSFVMLFKKGYGGFFTGTTIRIPYPVSSYSKTYEGAKIKLDNMSFAKLMDSDEAIESYYFGPPNAFGQHYWMSELSHSRQAIDGRLSKFRVIKHEIAGFLITFFTLRWRKKYDYVDAYGNRQDATVRYAYVAKYSYEYEAHSIVQPQIMKEYNQRMLNFSKGITYRPPPISYKRKKNKKKRKK